MASKKKSAPKKELPEANEAEIGRLQAKLDRAVPGSRLAINLGYQLARAKGELSADDARREHAASTAELDAQEAAAAAEAASQAAATA